MRPLVKICGLTDTASVATAVEAGADALGFVFAESVRRISVHRATRIASGVPVTVRRVAVMIHPSNDEWQEVLNGFAPDVLQTDLRDFDYLDVPAGIERWPVMRQGEAAENRTLPETFVYEGRSSGKGEAVDWRVAAELAKRGRMILAGGLDAGNVAEAINDVSPFGVDVSSGVESAPGEKDDSKIKEFIAAARGAATIGKEKGA